jgi:hypothetical protein
VSVKAPPVTVTPLPAVRYQYYQSALSMNISVLAKNLTPEEVHIVFSPTHLLVRVTQEGREGMYVCGW